MCLVEVEKMPKLATACTQTVAPDMIVKTDTPKVVKGRQGVLEFTLLNHPLDCPVCDKGGECPLQNNTFKYGPDDTRMVFERFNNTKAAPLSPVITLDQERCIACQRCTRYSDIIEKDQALVMLNRGFHNEIGTFNGQPYATRFSGNVIDICPVGALTNTKFRFQARTWDLDNAKTLCAHCGCNCNITFGARLNRLMRIESRPNDFVDDDWICDKGRFGQDFAESENRILQATANQGSEKLALDSAVSQVAGKLKEIVAQHGPESVGYIGSPFATNEELFLYQKIFRKLGSNNIDHKAYWDTPGLPVAHYDFEQVETSDLVILIGTDPTEELPILDLRLKKAVTRKGVDLIVLNDQKTLMDKYASISLRYHIGSDHATISALVNMLARELDLETGPEVTDIEKTTGVHPEQLKVVAEQIKLSLKTCVIYNPAALTGNGVQAVKHLLSLIARNPMAECGAIPAAPGTNALGAMDMGALPDFYPGGIALTETEKIKELWGETAPLQPGYTALQMIDKARAGELKALVVHRANLVVDFPGGSKVEEALKNLDFLVVHDMLHTETSCLAHLLLPSNGPIHDEGITTNIGGRVQYRRRGLKTDQPPDWKIISRINNELDDESGGTSYLDSFAVVAEIAAKVPGYGEIKRSTIQKVGKTRNHEISADGTRRGEKAKMEDSGNGALRLRVAHRLFANDKILEDSSPLAHHFQSPTAHLHETDAAKLGLKTGDHVRVVAGEEEMKAEVDVSNACNPGGVIIPKVSDRQRVWSLAQGEGESWVRVIKK
ncbi:MAG: molybdopterin-dependent oxidoreductase [Nitrospinota bacterium]|nr:molybdopterin-dependent oxidoreductase [Nitrospinota bacterium]